MIDRSIHRLIYPTHKLPNHVKWGYRSIDRLPQNCITPNCNPPVRPLCVSHWLCPVLYFSAPNAQKRTNIIIRLPPQEFQRMQKKKKRCGKMREKFRSIVPCLQQLTCIMRILILFALPSPHIINYPRGRGHFPFIESKKISRPFGPDRWPPYS